MTAAATTALRAMGCGVQAVVDVPGPEADLALSRLPAWFAARDACLSRFQPRSELSRVNARPGSQHRVSAELWEALERALEAARWTQGLVTPTVLEALERAGYDRSFELLDAQADQPPLPPVPSPPWQQVQLDAATRSVWPGGARLDLAGTAKGAAADALAEQLGAFGPGLVDVGGDIAVSGPRADGTPWPVGVADPHQPERPLAVLALSLGAAATSGRDYRRWERAGHPAHHLIDPRTGAPAWTNVVSATVVGDTALRSEIAAKVVVLLGSTLGLAWLAEQPGLDGCAVLEDGRIRTTPGFAERCFRAP